MYKTLQDFVGNTPLVRLVRIPGAESEERGNVILAKLEGNNPAGSVKDRPALSMIVHAEARGDIKPGDTLIEATSGNTGIALAMAAAMKGYRMILVMPENQSIERRQTMRAFGAELVLTPKDGGMELCRDVAEKMRDEGKGIILDQFANPDNPLAHYEGTGPEIWRDTEGKITHFVSSMGTTGTIMGTSAFLKTQNPAIQIVGCQPEEGSQIPGIRKWPEAYLPKIFDRSRVDRVENVSQADAEAMTRRLAMEEGIFAGISSGGALAVALREYFEWKRCFLVLGCNRDKDIREIGMKLSKLAELIICTGFDNPRAMDPYQMVQEVGFLGPAAVAEDTVAAAIDAALSHARAEDLICVTGSLYVVAEAREYLLGESVIRR